tara:strand:+ start:271 stop:1296 length:1026 start_codon:yes stop_codon:yes gene_type:complete
MKLKVGIAGYGIVGKRRHSCIDKLKNAEVVAVCDQKISNIKTKGSIKKFSSYLDLLEEDLDVVFVCLPNKLAPEVTKKCIEKDIHVFCEKPPGRTIADIKSVIKSIQLKPQLKLMYGFNHRYHDSVIRALSEINNKKMGKIINMRGVYGKSKLITFDQPIWRTKREIAGGGVLLDQGIHMVDLMRLFAGDFDKVYSFVENSFWNYDLEDNAYALMRNKKGIVAMLHSSATQWRHKFNLEINLEKGTLILSGILSSTKSYGEETLLISYASENDGGDPKEEIIRYEDDPSWDSEVRYFTDAIINNTNIESGTAKDALKTMELVYKIYYADPVWQKKYNITVN